MDIFGISLGYLWDIFVISLGYLGDILGISSRSSRSSIGPLVHWSIGPLVHWLNVKYQMPIVNKVNLLSERTSGVPPVILKHVLAPKNDFGIPKILNDHND